MGLTEVQDLLVRVVADPVGIAVAHEVVMGDGDFTAVVVMSNPQTPIFPSA